MHGEDRNRNNSKQQLLNWPKQVSTFPCVVNTIFIHLFLIRLGLLVYLFDFNFSGIRLFLLLILHILSWHFYLFQFQEKIELLWEPYFFSKWLFFGLFYYIFVSCISTFLIATVIFFFVWVILHFYNLLCHLTLKFLRKIAFESNRTTFNCVFLKPFSSNPFLI